MTTKKTPKTPATNAGKDVADGDRRPVLMFVTGDLPGLDRFASGENMIGPIADVCFASGYFGDLTPAQIAVHIMAGRSLGLDDMQGAFDLTIGPDRSIQYRAGKPFEKAGDDVEALKQAVRPTPDATPDPASRARDNVHPIRSIAADEQAAADKANKGPSPTAEPEPGPEGPQGPENVTGPANVETGGQSDDGVIARAAIAKMLTELGIDRAAIDERLARFDNADDKAKLLKDCRTFYANKVETARLAVVQRLEADGKKTPDSQKGFFIFAGVSADPHNWTYVEAAAARDALPGFFNRDSDPPAAAA